MKSIATWKLINNSLDKGIAVMLLYVLDSTGSSPGRQGFFIAINETGETEGSIGGGIMEHKLTQMAKEQLRHSQDDLQAGMIKKQIHDKSSATNQSGMICSGEQTILLYQLKQTDLTTIREIIHSLEQNKNGTLHLFPGGISFSHTVPEKDFLFEMQSEEDWNFVEKSGYKNHLFIIGGGHCALAFAKLMSSIDFYIHQFDDRKEVKTMLQNEYAHEKYFVNDYSELSDLVPSGTNHYVIIMTVGYRTDDIALKALMDKEFRYLGMLGSKTKIQKMMEEYRQHGVKEEWLQRIDAPAGLEIKSQAPEEIAVSIAAAIIQVKNSPL